MSPETEEWNATIETSVSIEFRLFVQDDCFGPEHASSACGAQYTAHQPITTLVCYNFNYLISFLILRRRPEKHCTRNARFPPE